MRSTPHLQFPTGQLEVVCGPMFSGKTEELIRRVKRAQIARQKVQIFRPKIDDRYHDTDIVSHSAQSMEAKAIGSAIEIMHAIYDSTRVVGIDEIQFFSDDIVPVVSKLVRRGLRVICAGLDQDFRGMPFGSMPTLLALADDVLKVSAICTVCGQPATKTQRMVEDDNEVLIGAFSAYEARCREHFEIGIEKNENMPQKIELQSKTPSH